MPEAQAYRGQFRSVALGIDTPVTGNPSDVSATFDWLAYTVTGGSVVIRIDLSSGSPGLKLDQLRALRIDNMQSRFPVVAKIPSTGQIVKAPPGKIVVEPLFSSNAAFEVLFQCDGLVSGQKPITEAQIVNVNRAGYEIADTVIGGEAVFAGAFTSFTPPNLIFNYSPPTGYAVPDFYVAAMIVDTFVSATFGAPNTISETLVYNDGTYAFYTIENQNAILQATIVQGGVGFMLCCMYAMYGFRSIAPINIVSPVNCNPANPSPRKFINPLCPAGSAIIVQGQAISNLVRMEGVDTHYASNTRLSGKLNQPIEAQVKVTPTLITALNAAIWR